MRESLRAALRALGIALRDDWLAACDAHLRAAHPGFDALPHDRQLELVYAQFLQCDLNTAGAATLPDVETMHDKQLQGRFVLQLDEAANIGVAARERYAERERRAGDCYKLSLTDGARRCVGFEHAPLPWLRHDTPAGAKVAVTHAHVRRGLLLLTPQCIELLGGCAPRLEAARLRAVERWNAPPGCDAAARRRAAAAPPPGAPQPPVPSLAEAAAEAAWAPEAGQAPGVLAPPPAPAFAPPLQPPPRQQQQQQRQQQQPQVVSLLDNDDDDDDDDEDAPLGARMQQLRAGGASGDPLPPQQQQPPPAARAPAAPPKREALPPAPQLHRPEPQPPPPPPRAPPEEYAPEPVAVRVPSPVLLAGAFGGGAAHAPGSVPGSGSKSGTSQRRQPWERFGGEPFTYISALQAQAAAGGPFPVRGCIHGYLWTVQRFKYADASNVPLPGFELLVTLEDGSGSASAAFSNAAVAEHLGMPTPAAMAAALHPDAPGRDAVRARFARFEALLRTHVGGLDVEIPAPGALLCVTRIRADLRDLGAADAATAGAQRDADASRAAYALLERLGRNGC